ncbi:hypothetical protein ACTXT7_005347 [Hymenolepis weldensis]
MERGPIEFKDTEVTRVATITIYSYFVASLFVWQFLDVNQKYSYRLADLYILMFGILQLIFFLELDML